MDSLFTGDKYIINFYRRQRNVLLLNLKDLDMQWGGWQEYHSDDVS